jgi:hypothetical protein
VHLLVLVNISFNSQVFFKRSVIKLAYVDAEILVTIMVSEVVTMRVSSVATGVQKEQLDGGNFAFSKKLLFLFPLKL